MASLAQFQAAFLDAVLAPDATAAQTYATQPGFAVYRNTVMSGCIDALEANYPSVGAQLGEARFREAAHRYVSAAPPRDGVLAAYGDSFATWLDGAVDADLRGAAALARLDRCWTESHLAADATALEATELAALAPERFAAGRLVPHPAARWLTFDANPAFSAWRRCREPLEAGSDVAAQGGESALLTRPAGVVRWRAIDAAAAAFLSLCGDGRAVASALDAVAEAGLDADLAAWLPSLMHARAFTRFDAADGEGR